MIIESVIKSKRSREYKCDVCRHLYDIRRMTLVKSTPEGLMGIVHTVELERFDEGEVLKVEMKRLILCPKCFSKRDPRWKEMRFNKYGYRQIKTVVREAA